jgi:hypothetical protein
MDMSRPTIRSLLVILEGALKESEHSYIREIPRDLFNEANILKCYGQLYLQIERMNPPDVELVHDGAPFMVAQDSSSGFLTIANVQLVVRGKPIFLSRPLNSRNSWSLYAVVEDEDVEVFDGSGNLTPEMRAILQG